jgi:hypothetical protein
METSAGLRPAANPLVGYAQPSLPDVTLLLVGVAVLIPVLTTVLTNRRRRRVAIRIISLVLTVLMALGLLSRDVLVAVAAPDAFYLHTDSLNGGEMMNLTAGSGSVVHVRVLPGKLLKAMLLLAAVRRDAVPSAGANGSRTTSLVVW